MYCVHMKNFILIYLILIFCLHLSIDGSAQSKKQKAKNDSIKEDDNVIYTKTERHSSFPGDADAWFEFANKNFDYAAVLQQIPGDFSQFKDSIIVKFIVGRTGELSDFTIEKGNPMLKEPVIKLLKSSPKWLPEEQGGRYVKAYRRLRIDVLIEKNKNIKKVEHLEDSYNYFYR